MARPRTPLSKAKITGADKANPSRFKDRSEPQTTPLGKASPHFTDRIHIRVWGQFRREIPWLTECDRATVEMAVALRSRVVSGEEVGIHVLTQLRLLLSSMGATPADRSKISVPPKTDPDDISHYFN